VNTMMNLVFDAVTTLYMYVYVTVSWYEIPCSFLGRCLRRTAPAYQTTRLRNPINFKVSELLDSMKGLTSLTIEATVVLSGRIVFHDNVLLEFMVIKVSLAETAFQ
jgi:hypothetical protein